MSDAPRGDGGGGPEPIAIVGMACVFPGAGDLRTYWKNILDKVDAVGDAPPEWCGDLFLDPDSQANDRIYTKAGGFLRDLAVFDPLRHGVMPNSIDGGEPDQFLALEVASDAVEDAEFAARPVPGDRVAVILGRGTYINRGFTGVVQHGIMVDRVVEVLRTLHPETDEAELAEIKRKLKDSLPPFNAEMAPALVPNLVTGRISNRLDFRGTNYIVDAACASSLIALERGVADLRAGRCDMAVVGGVHASTPPPIYQIFCQLEALSRSSRIRPFSSEADGTLLGEGVGILCIKRLSDAEAAGDRIYALVRSVGVASDGKGLGILAPRLEGEALALERAYEESGVDPESVGLVEAHGTATAVGDATEVEALVNVFGERRHGTPHCALGSVKSMIGHCLPASGSAGLIKAAMALHHRTLPPTLVETPNPELGIDRSPFYLNTEARAWVHGAPEPRRAGVNAFGFGGINAHAVLEEYRGAPEPEGVASRPSEALLLDGTDADALAARIATMTDALKAPDVSLAAVTAEAAAGLGQGDWRLGVVASDAQDAIRKLEKAAERIGAGKTRLRDRKGVYLSADPLLPDGKVAFLFPGEGSQYRNMLGPLLLHFPEMRAWFDLVDSAFVDHPRGLRPSEVIFPPPGTADEGDALWRMDLGPAAIFAGNQAVASLYDRIGLSSDMLVGHSTGEYSALYRAGVTRRDDPETLKAEMRALNAAYERMEREGIVARGVLMAVGAVDHDRLLAKIGEREDVFLAMDNCPNQKVVSVLGPEGRAFVEQVTAELGGLCETLPFDRAYHSPAFAEFSARLREFLNTMPMAEPSLPVWSCLTAAPLDPDPDQIRRDAALQWSGRVRFAETIERMHAEGARVFVECGPRNNLTAFVEDILRKRPHRAVAVDTPSRQGIDQLNHLIAQLAVERVPLDSALGRPRQSQKQVVQRPGKPIVLKTGIQPMRLEGVVSEAPKRAPRRDEPHLAPEPAGPVASPLLKAAERSPVRAPSPAAASPVPRGPSAAPPPGRLPTSPEPGVGQIAAGHRSVADAYFDTMERLVASERDILTAVMNASRAPSVWPAPAASAVAPAATPAVAPPPSAEPGTDRFPMLTVVSAAADRRSLTARIEIDPAKAPYLYDHSFGRDVSSADPGLHALLVVPLTFSMEALAQAAAALRPDLVVTGMREVRASRWIAVDQAPLGLEATAELLQDGAETVIRVRLREAEGPALRPVIVEADVELAPERPRAPATEPRRDPGPATWTLQDVYSRIMFHGPKLQAVESLDLSDEGEAGGVLVGMAHDGLFASTRDPRLETDAITLDAVGQLVGVWSADRLPQAFHIFPFRVERLQILRGRLLPGERARCRAEIRLIGGEDMRSDIEVVTADGRLQCRIEGWWDKRFDLPDRFFQARLDPHRNRSSRPLPLPAMLSARPGLSAAILDDLDDAFMEGSGGIWPRVLAGLTLSRAERSVWQALGAPARRLEWLRGRVAAKDAVRALIPDAIAAADVPILASEPDGPPAIAPECPLSVKPHISISHSGPVAVGLAADPALYAGAGIDVERVAPRDEAFLRTAFRASEREAIAGAPEGPDRDRLATRIWAAKEAAAKAFGADLAAALEAFEALPDPVDGSVRVRPLDGAYAGLVEVAADECAPGLVVAIAVRPAS